jgi:hypothetical protein
MVLREVWILAKCRSTLLFGWVSRTDLEIVRTITLVGTRGNSKAFLSAIEMVQLKGGPAGLTTLLPLEMGYLFYERTEPSLLFWNQGKLFECSSFFALGSDKVLDFTVFEESALLTSVCQRGPPCYLVHHRLRDPPLDHAATHYVLFGNVWPNNESFTKRVRRHSLVTCDG